MGIWHAAAETAATATATTAGSGMRQACQDAIPASKLLDEVQSLLRRFVAYVDPDALLECRAGTSNGETDTQEHTEVPISDWTVLHTSLSAAASASATLPSSSTESSPNIVVRKHPSANKHLFSVQFVVPGITARQFWTLMANTANRYLWDGSVEESDVLRWLHLDKALEGDEAQMAASIGVKVEYMRFGSIMLVAGKRDMVLLTADTRLASSSFSSSPIGNSQSSNGRIRLVSASCSIQDPSLPPRKGYNRFPLNIGGFLVEDLGVSGLPGDDDLTKAAIRVTQVSDLGEMAAWVPASVIRMVAGSMVPRSVASIAKVAAKMEVPPVLLHHQTTSSDTREDSKSNMLEVQELSRGFWQRHRGLPVLINAANLGLLPKTKVKKRSAAPHADMESLVGESMVIPGQEAASATVPPQGLTLQRLSTRLPSSFTPSLNAPGGDNADRKLDGYPFPSRAAAVAAIGGEPDMESSFDSDSFGISSGRSRLSIAVGSGSETIPGTPNEDDAEQGRDLSSDESSQEIEAEDESDSSACGDRDATLTLSKRMASSQNIETSMEAEKHLNGSVLPALLEDGTRELHKRMARLSRVYHEQSRSGSSSESQDHRGQEAAELTSLLAEALQADVAAEQGGKASQYGTATTRRKSRAQREASRISALLLSGSDAVAIAIAPAARQSCHIPVRSPPQSTLIGQSIVEEPSELANNIIEATNASAIKPSGSGRRTRLHSFHRSASGASSSLAPPATSLEFASGLRQSFKVSTSRRPSFASSLSGSSSVGSGSSSSNNNAGIEAGSSSLASIAAEGRNEASSYGWVSGLKDVPYALALGMISLAWAGKQAASQEAEDADRQEESGEDLFDDQTGSSFVMPTASALEAARELLQRGKASSTTTTTNASRKLEGATKKPRPLSHYNPQDSKLHPFPASLGRAGGHNLPPVGIAANRPVLMECAPAKEINRDANVDSLQAPSNKSSWWFA